MGTTLLPAISSWQVFGVDLGLKSLALKKNVKKWERPGGTSLKSLIHKATACPDSTH